MASGLEPEAIPAGRAWRVSSAPAGVTVARPGASRPGRWTAGEQRLLTRRSLLRGSFWAGAGVTGAGLLLGFVNYVWPRTVERVGALYRVAAAEVPAAGSGPKFFHAGRFYLVNLWPGEGVPEQFRDFADPSPGGLIALSQKCPHLGCAIPWSPEFEFKGVRSWFRCPCHQSTYTEAGVRVFGPAPRSMDTFPVTRNEDGTLSVDTRLRTPGGTDNPQRAVLL